MGDLDRLGSQGESFALALLKKRGHRLLERNFRCPQGELDLVTWQRGTLVFTEVRARTSTAQSPAESITPQKQGRVVRAAQWYLAKRAGGRSPPACRFDVVWLAAKKGEIVDGGVIEGAFTA